MWSPTHVQIVVQRARNVIPKGKNGTNDAYVVIQNGKEKFQTSVKEQSVDPVWQEECDLLLENKETDTIKLTAFHRNLFGLADEFLGQALIPLNEFDIYERPKSRWYTLEGKANKKSHKYRGELEVRITFVVKNCNIEKTKKKPGIHQSLLDIRGGLKHNSDKSNDNKNSMPRKFSISGNINRPTKLTSRSLSFKIDSLNTRRKSLVDKILKRQDSVSHNRDEDKRHVNEHEVKKQNTSEQKVQIDTLVEETNQSHESIDNRFEKNCKNVINSDESDEDKNEIKNELKQIFERQDMSEQLEKLDTKSSSSKPSKISLKRALSSNDLHIKSPPIRPNRIQRSSTLNSFNGKTDKLPQFHARNEKLSKNEEKINNNTSYSLKDNNLRQTENKFLSKFMALKNYERRHTLDISQKIPNLLKSSNASEKRATQASPDSMYSSFESLVNRKPTKTDYHQKYQSLNKEELIQLIESQQMTIFGLNDQINDLEEYIDNLLVRVIENSPRILQNSYRIKNLLNSKIMKEYSVPI